MPSSPVTSPRTAQDLEQLIPVVFPVVLGVSRPLAVWLVDELQQRYDVPHTIGQAWVDADQVLPLLDGLDEVQSEHRAACADAINTFRRDHGLLPLAVCSRITEYGAPGFSYGCRRDRRPAPHARAGGPLCGAGWPALGGGTSGTEG